jgi:hypothetical protein
MPWRSRWRIVATGPARLITAMKGSSTQVVDLDGKTVIPGMIDAHVHLMGLGQALQTVDLRGTTSYDEIIARVAERAKGTPAGRWIMGVAWDQNDWADTRFPTHDKLSAAVPGHPVFLSRVDGHAALLNAAAMKAAAITASSKDPFGGHIERAANGAPTGVLVDAAMSLVEKVIPPPSTDELRAAATAATQELNRWGLTSVHDAGVGKESIDVFEALAKEGKFPLRNYVMIAGDSANLAYYFGRGPQSGLYDGHLWIKAIKMVADGASLRGACSNRTATTPDDRLDAHPGRRGAPRGRRGAPSRLPAQRARHRRPCQPHRAQRVRGGPLRRPLGRPSLPYRARADHPPR